MQLEYRVHSGEMAAVLHLWYVGTVLAMVNTTLKPSAFPVNLLYTHYVYDSTVNALKQTL